MKTASTFHVLVLAGSRVSRLGDCLRTFEAHNPTVPYKLEILDPSGVIQPQSMPKSLEEILEKIPIHHVPQVNPFIFQACMESESDFLVVLRGDSLVPCNFLKRMQEAVWAGPNHVLVTPLSNAGSPYRLPVIPGANPRIMDDYLRENLPGELPDAEFGLGCCFLIHLEWFRRLDRWSRIHGRWEPGVQEPFHARFKDCYRMVVADRIFVHHDVSWTTELEDVWKQILEFWGGSVPRDKWDSLNGSQWYTQLQQRVGFFPEGTLDRPAKFREMARRSKKAAVNGNPRDVIRAVSHGMADVLRSRRLPREIPCPPRTGESLRVLYLINDFVVAGGVYSVVQLVNELTLLGADAMLGYVRKSHEVDSWPLLTRPIRFTSMKDFLRRCPKCDVVVATHWTTANWVSRLVDAKKARLSVYFIQDFEAWFYLDNERRNRQLVMDSYDLLPHKIVKSDWLKKLLKDAGHPAKKIPLGLDLGTFFPRTRERNEKVRIISMARPSTPRRGFQFVIDTLSAVSHKRPNVEIVLFGHDYLRQIPFDFIDLGVIGDVQQLPKEFSRSDIFFEGSEFQAFGRTTLECMACGIACVLTDQGGVHEYASHQENCVMISYGDVPAAVQAILHLIDHPEERRRLSANGVKTARGFDHKKEARRTLEYFRELLDTEETQLQMRSNQSSLTPSIS